MFHSYRLGPLWRCLLATLCKQRILTRRYRCERQLKVASIHTFYDALIKSKVAAYRCLRLLRQFGRSLFEFTITLGLKE